MTAERSGERVVVLDAAGETLSTLSPVGALIWDRLPADIAAIVDNLADRFPDVERARLAGDAEQFLADLREAGLVVDVDADG